MGKLKITQAAAVLTTEGPPADSGADAGAGGGGNWMDQATKALYGKPEVQTHTGLFGMPGSINAGEEQPLPPGQIHRDLGEGSPPSSYNGVLDDFFNAREYGARSVNDELQIDALGAAKKGANEILTAFDVGESGAKDIFRLVGDYMDNPRPPEVIETQRASVEAEVKKAFGRDYEKMSNAARHVLKEAGKRIPGFIEFVDQSGLGNNIDFIKRLAHIGKRRGFAR